MQVVVAQAALQRQPARGPLILRVERGRHEVADVLMLLSVTMVCVSRFGTPLFVRTG